MKLFIFLIKINNIKFNAILIDFYIVNNMALPPIEEQVMEPVDVFNPCKHAEILFWQNREK